MKITKTFLICLLKSFGVKANYSNVLWCYDVKFNIVGGVNHGVTSSANQKYFIVKDNDICFVNSFDEIKKLQYGGENNVCKS